ncbi:MAG TPA: hypothetical protein VJO33_07645 [Gemmatimonadaceae bacterium]|nr:hypothetical protein [Gemmatimonadaceae bacterium]
MIEQLRAKRPQRMRLTGRHRPHPQRITRHERFREHDEPCAFRRRFSDPLARAIDRRFPIEKRGTLLDGSDEEWMRGNVWH